MKCIQVGVILIKRFLQRVQCFDVCRVLIFAGLLCDEDEKEKFNTPTSLALNLIHR